MKPTPLVLACVLALLAPSCKKSESTANPEAPGKAAAAPTKSSQRESHRDGEGLAPGMDGDPRDTEELIALAETIFNERQEITNKITGATVEQEISERMGDTAGVDKAKGKAADLASEIHDQDQTFKAMLRKLRSRRDSEPDNESLGTFVTYIEQMDLVNRKRLQVSELQAASSDEASLEAARKDLAAESLKLRELRLAWQASKPKEEKGEDKAE